MKFGGVFALVLFSSASLSSGLTLVGSKSQSDELEWDSSEKTSAITKVVKILQRMQAKSKEDAETMRVNFAKHKCFCEHTDADLVKSIDDNAKLIELLGGEIQEIYGHTGQLSTEVAKLHADMLANKAAQDEAIKLRSEEHDKFIATRRDMEQSIEQMDYALHTLADVGADQTMASAAFGKEFMRGHGASATSLVKLTDDVRKIFDVAAPFMSDDDSQVVGSFLQAPFSGDYKAQSGQVVGVLKNMKKTFKIELEDAQTTEFKAKKTYKEFMTAKGEEYSNMNFLYEEKQKILNSNDKTMAAKKQQMSAAKEQKADDEASLEELRAVCAQKAKEYDERKALRANEDTAIAEAISILNNEHAFETFGKVDSTNANGATGAASFVQTSASVTRAAKDARNTVKHILTQANVLKSQKLSNVLDVLEKGDFDVTLSQKNPFVEVINEIEKMMKLCDDEGEQDENQFEWCNEERQENNQKHEDLENSATGLESDVDDLKNDIGHEETGTKAQIAHLEASLMQNHKNNIQNEKDRNEDYNRWIEDERNLKQAIKILTKANDVLTTYYEKISAASALLQQKKTGKKQAPETWEGDYKGQSGQGNSVLNMLSYILRQSKNELAEAKAAEDKSWEDYSAEKESLKNAKDDMESQLSDRKQDLADQEYQLGQKRADLKNTYKENNATLNYLADIKPGCDFITTNLEARNAARKMEKDALLHAEEVIKETPFYAAFDPETGAARGHRNAYNKQIGQYIGETAESCRAFKEVTACEQQGHCIWDSTGLVCQEPASSS